MPPDIDARPRGEDSQEKDTQEEREKSSLGTLYATMAQIPESPAEPSSQISLDQVDVSAKMMLAGGDVQPFFTNASSVADLVGQLRTPSTEADQQLDPTSSASMLDVPMYDGMLSTQQYQQGVGPGGFDLRGLGLDPAALAALTQQLAMGSLNFAHLQQAFSSANSGMPLPDQSQAFQQQASSYTEYGSGYENGSEVGVSPRGKGREWGGDRGSSRSRRRKGGGGGGGASGGVEHRNNRKPCSFFAAGSRALNLKYFAKIISADYFTFVFSPWCDRCKFGDHCDYSHDVSY